MPENDLIHELMLRWEAGRQQGAAPRPEDLCAEHPELTAELRRRIRAVEDMERILGVDPRHAYATDVGNSASAGREPDSDLLPQIPGYEIIRAVDQGGMGVVYE